MKKRTLSIIICLSILAILFSSCSKKDAKTLKIGALSDVSSVPLYIAEYEKFLPETTEIVKFASAADRDAALQAGEIDGTISDVIGAALAINGGFDVKITSRTEGEYKLMASKNFEEAEQLVFKNVGISANTIIEYCADIFSNEFELEKIVVAQMPVRLEMLADGQLDSAVLPEPLATISTNSGATQFASSSEVDLDISIILFSKTSIDTKAAEIKEFYKAYNKSCDFINKQKDAETLQKLMENKIFPEGLPVDTYVLPEYRKADMNSQQAFEECISWMLSKGIIADTIAWDVAIDDQFVK